MPIKTLDALALATLPEPALISRIAALWCRAHYDRAPHCKVEIIQWVKQEFGPIIDPSRREHIALRLIEETKRQIRARRRRKKAGEPIDPLTTPFGSPTRLGALLNSRLGPALMWVGQKQANYRGLGDGCYIDGAVFSGLVAGLIPVQLRLRRFVNPSLLVYRQGWREPRSYWVPGHITSVADAFIWLIPPEAAEFLQLDGSRVEHDGEAQAIRLITQFGTKILPWRQL